MEKTIIKVIKDDAHTYFGFAEYFGKRELYDGNSNVTCEGSAIKVIGFLQDLRVKLDVREEGLCWRGQNGMWYSGQRASRAISEEIKRVEEFEAENA